jgi:peptidylprolyl isomerase
MKRLLAVTAALSIAGLAAACTGDASEDSKEDPLAKVTWVDGDPPSLEFEKPFDLGVDQASRVAKEGDGAAAEPGSLVQVNFVMMSGQDGTTFASTYEDGGAPVPYQMPEEKPEGDYVWAAIKGQKVGADVIVAYREPATTTDPSAESGSPTASPTTDPTYLIALSIVSVQEVPDGPEGETVVPDDPGLPVVTLADDGEPSIEVPEGVEPPKELVSQLLIKGSGPPVEETQSITANYAGWLWDGEPFDSSWGRGEPSTFSLQGVIAGWTKGLTGVPVGSQVLLVVPPDLGYGEDGNGSIPGGSTLIFVVDVLSAM